MRDPDSARPVHGAAAILAKRGWTLFDQPPQPIEFTDLPQANALLNDLAGHPHAFVLACLCDRQDSAVRVWRIPYLLGQRVGSVAFDDLAALSAEQIALAMIEPEPLHRYPAMMAEVVHRGLQHIAGRYKGDAARLWGGTPSSASIILGFLGFYGAGIKIASMAANILVRELKIPVSDKYSARRACTARVHAHWLGHGRGKRGGDHLRGTRGQPRVPGRARPWGLGDRAAVVSADQPEVRRVQSWSTVLDGDRRAPARVEFVRLERPPFLRDQVGEPYAGNLQLAANPRDLRPRLATVLALAGDHGRTAHLRDHDDERVSAVAAFEALGHLRIPAEQRLCLDRHCRVGRDDHPVLSFHTPLLGRKIAALCLVKDLFGTDEATFVDQVIDSLPERRKAGWAVVALEPVDQSTRVDRVHRPWAQPETTCSSLSSLSKRTSR